MLICKNFEDKLRGCVEIEYYANKAIKIEVPYNFGKKNGLQKEYDENGNLKKQIDYRDGVKNGTEIEYYQNGKIMAERIYSNDVMNGLQKEYYASGNTKQETLCKYGKIESEVEYYDSNIRKVKREIVSTNVSQIECLFYESGSLAMITQIYIDTYEGLVKDGFEIEFYDTKANNITNTAYNNGFLTIPYQPPKTLDYLPNHIKQKMGRKKRESNYKYNIKEGKEIEYYNNSSHDNQKIKSQKIYNNGNLQYETQYFDNNNPTKENKPKLEIDYKMQTEIEYYENGNKKREISLYDPYHNKQQNEVVFIEKEYDENGNLKIETQCNKNKQKHGKEIIYSTFNSRFGFAEIKQNRKEKETQYKNGKLDENRTEIYYGSGDFWGNNVVREIPYKNNKIHGVVKILDKKGRQEIPYNNGKVDGELKWYCHYGLHFIILFKNGIALEIKDYKGNKLTNEQLEEYKISGNLPPCDCK